MIREVIKPIDNDFHIKIPDDYLNKEVEFIMFPLDEREKIQDQQKQTSKKSLRGVFSKYADSSKQALEDKAWENHVIDKYTKQND